MGFVGGALFYNGGRYAAEIGHMLASNDSVDAVKVRQVSEVEDEHADDDHGEAGDDHGESAGACRRGGLVLSKAQIAAAGIELVDVQARAMSTYISLPGEVNFDEERTAHVVPPSAGVVERVLVGLGQKVAAGDGLATIVSQQVSELRSEMAAAARRVELARTTFERERQLWKDGISAEQDYLRPGKRYRRPRSLWPMPDRRARRSALRARLARAAVTTCVHLFPVWWWRSTWYLAKSSVRPVMPSRWLI